MKTVLKDLTRIQVDPKELIFLNENAPTGFIALIRESLSDKKIYLSRDQVWRELTVLKKDYMEVVIHEARRILKALKGLEYVEETV